MSRIRIDTNESPSKLGMGSLQRFGHDFLDGDSWIMESSTVLSQLILQREFLTASKRVRNFPKEARTWVSIAEPDHSQNDTESLPHQPLVRQNSWPYGRKVHKRPRQTPVPVSNNSPSQRHLPLHIALQFLANTKASKHSKLEQLIRHLVSAYPGACRFVDPLGRFPLHEAIAWKASPHLIYRILLAYPDALTERDSSQRLPLQIHDMAPRPDAPNLGARMKSAYRLWEHARLEAATRFHLLGTLQHGPSTPDRHTRPEMDFNASLNSSFSGDRSGVVFSDLLERNRTLVQVVDELTEKLEQNDGVDDQTQEKWYALEDENDDLRRQLLQTELVLHDAGYDSTGVLFSSYPGIHSEWDQQQGISMMSMDPQPPSVLTKYLETKVEELAADNDQLEFQLETYEQKMKEWEERNEQDIKKTKLIKTTSIDGKLPSVDDTSTNVEQSHATSTADHSTDKDLRRRIAELEFMLLEAQTENELLRNAERTDGQPHLDPGLQHHRSFSLETLSQDKQKRLESLVIVQDDTQQMSASTGKLPRRLSLEAHLKQIDQLSDPAFDVVVLGNGNQKKRAGVQPKRRSLEHHLKEIDRLSGHDTKKDAKLPNPTEAPDSPVSDSKRAVSTSTDTFGHDSFQTGNETQATGKYSNMSKVTTSSWGMLSFAQPNPRKSIRKQCSIPTPLETLEQGNESKLSLGVFQTEAFHESFRSFTEDNDDLEDIYKFAADFFESKAVLDANFIPPTPTFEKKSSPPRKRMKGHRRNSDGGATTAIYKQRRRSDAERPKRKDPVVETAHMLAAEEEMEAILDDAENLLDEEIPFDFHFLMKEAAWKLSVASRFIGNNDTESIFQTQQAVSESLINYKLFDLVEKEFGNTVPAALVSSLRTVAISRVESTRQEIEATEMMKKRLEQELLDALIDTTVREFHVSLEQNVVGALRVAATYFDSLLREDQLDDETSTTIHLDFGEVDRMFAKAQEVLGEPFTSEQLSALRRSAFVLQSRLEGTESIRTGISRDSKWQISTVSSSTFGLQSTSTSGVSSVSPKRSASVPGYAKDNDTRQTSEVSRSKSMPSDGVSCYDIILPLAVPPEPSVSGQSGEGGRRKRRPSQDGGEDPGRMYSVARARSRSPTASQSDNLELIYDKAILARARSSSPEHGQEDLEGLFRRASLGRSSDHQPNYLDSAGSDDKVASKENGVARRRSSRQDAPTPPARKKSWDPLRMKDNQEGPPIPNLPDMPQVSQGGQTDIQVFPPAALDDTLLKKIPNAEEVETILIAARQVLGRDISEELLGALKLLSKSAASSVDQGGETPDVYDQKQEESDEEDIMDEEMEDAELSYNDTENGQNEDNDVEEEDDEEYEIKSTEMSRHSEISLNLSAVFKSAHTSELGKKLQKLDEQQTKLPPKATKTTSAHAVAPVYNPRETSPNTEDQTAPSMRKNTMRGRSPRRGIRQTKSNDICELFTAPSEQKTSQLRRSKSATAQELEFQSRSATGKVAVPGAHSSLLVGEKGAETDDLEQLFKIAAVENGTESPFHASTVHLQDKKGDAAFENIISDTEETYGIEVTSEVVEALKFAVLKGSPEVPFISIVRSLHDDTVINEAESRLGDSIAPDLIAAIRSTSLPPGVSVVTLRPLEGSTSGRRNRYNTSQGSMALSLSMTDSSRRSSAPRMNLHDSSTRHELSTLRSDVMAGGVAPLGESAKLLRSDRESEQAHHGSASESDRSSGMDHSTHSENSWGVLSLSKSPDSQGAKRKRRRATKKHRKGTKEAMFERAQKRKDKANEFMNSLAELPLDDLVDLYKQAHEKLEPAPNRNLIPPTAVGNPPAQGTSEAVPGENDLVGSTGSADDGSIHQTPLEVEFDMLMARFKARTGRDIPHDIELALRNGIVSMVEGSEEEELEHISFGTFLTESRLDSLLEAAEVHLGSDLGEGIQEALKEAAKSFTENTEDDVEDASSSGESIVSEEEMGERPSTTVPSFQKKVESLLEVTQGDEDDLTQLYKAAYAQAPRVDSSHERAPAPDFTVPAFSTPAKKVKRKALSPEESSGVPVGGLPLSHVEPYEEELELTESGRFVVALSPMTEASISTMHNSGKMMDMIDAAKAHLRTLGNVPQLDDSGPLNIADDLESCESENLADDIEDGGSEESASLAGDHPRIENSTINSSQTAFELDAIISEAQEEYGMELPPDLIEALKAASVASLGEFDSAMGSSSMSSLNMHHFETEGTKQDGPVRDLAIDVRNKLAKSDNDVSRSIARRWKVEENFEGLIVDAEEELDQAMSDELVDDIWEVFVRKCDDEGVECLSWSALQPILVNIQGCDEAIIAALEKASQDMQVTFHDQASGYFSAVSDSDVDDFAGDDRTTTDIASELKHLQTEEAQETQIKQVSAGIGEGSAKFDASADLAGIKFSGSTMFEYSTDLEYSESTFSSLAHGSFQSLNKHAVYKKPSQNSGYFSGSYEDSLSRIDENASSSELDYFLHQATKEYGQSLPDDLVVALKHFSVSSGLSFEPEHETKFAAGRSEQLGVKLSPELAGALQRAASKSSKHSSKDFKVRQVSEISALSGFSEASLNTSASSVDWDVTAQGQTLEEPVPGVDTNVVDTSTDNQIPPPPPPPPPPLPPTSETPSSIGNASGHTASSRGSYSRNLGPGILRELKRVYEKKIPPELNLVLVRSETLPNAMNTDEEIQIILEECEDISGKRLPADLVLAIREASVRLRAPATASKSRRSKLMKQGSGSFRSTSRSSGMPSIQEWTASTVTDLPSKVEAEGGFEVDRVPSSFGPLTIPSEIAAEEQSNMDVSTLKDSQHTEGTSTKPMRFISRRASKDVPPKDPSKGVSKSMVSMQSLQYSEPSTEIEARNSSMTTLNQASNTSSSLASFVYQSGGDIRLAPQSPGFSPFNASAATMLVSNTFDHGATKKWIPPPSVAVSEALDKSSEHNSSVVSTGSSTSTEVTANNSSAFAAHAEEVSQASTLPSSKLPLGVNPVPPLDGVETDDLSAIFKEAARRFG